MVTKSVKEKLRLNRIKNIKKRDTDINIDSPHRKRLENFEVIPFSGNYEASKAMVISILQKFEMFQGRPKEEFETLFKLMVYCKDKEDAPYVVR